MGDRHLPLPKTAPLGGDICENFGGPFGAAFFVDHSLCNETSLGVTWRIIIRKIYSSNATFASYLYPNWMPYGVQIAMTTSPKAQCRLEPITHAYLEDLARLGAYGKGKSGVMRRFIESGIKEALEKQVIQKRSIEEFGGSVSDDDEVD